MKKIIVSDVTLREYAKSKHTLSFKESVEVAKLIDKLNYDSIEMPEIKNFSTDTLLIKTISGLVKYSGVCVSVGYDVSKIQSVFEAVQGAKKPILKVSVPVSTVQMEYLCSKKPKMIIAMIGELVAECKKYCENVEFSAGDAFRAEREFLYEAVKTAIDAGATSVTLCDAEEMAMPEDCSKIVNDVCANVEGAKDIILCVEASSKINMACANVFEAVNDGAAQIKTTVDGFGYPTIGDIFSVISQKGDSLGISSGIRSIEINRITSQIKDITNATTDYSTEELKDFKNTSADSLTLDKTASITTVINAVEKIGYEVSPEDQAHIYDAFKRVAAKKDFVGTKELEAIIATTAMQVPPTYKIDSYVINSGNVITATANIKLIKNNDTPLSGVSTGDGPIDAAFMAIEQIIGHHYELDDFQIRSVTEGREAMGSALVKLRSSDGKLYSGTGISTDVIGASIRAYVSALNKIAYEEEA